MDELDKKKARDLAVIANAANELRKGFDASSDDIFELMLEGIKKVPGQLQRMVDTVVMMQKEFPFPEGGWEMFLRDLEHTNRKHGLNLYIKSELFNE